MAIDFIYRLIELICVEFLSEAFFNLVVMKYSLYLFLRYDKYKVIVLTPINGRHYKITQYAVGKWVHSARLGALASRCSILTML